MATRHGHLGQTDIPAAPESPDFDTGEGKAGAYHAPEMVQVGTLKQVRGRNYYRDKDAGNDNYYC